MGLIHKNKKRMTNMKERTREGNKPDIVENKLQGKKWEIISFPKSLFEVTRKQRAALVSKPEKAKDQNARKRE